LKPINKHIKKALPLAILLYLALVAFMVTSKAQRAEPDLHDLDKRLSILESKEQDRRDNNSLLYTVVGGNVLNVLLTAFLLKAHNSNKKGKG
jgi:hypothetical protein